MKGYEVKPDGSIEEHPYMAQRDWYVGCMQNSKDWHVSLDTAVQRAKDVIKCEILHLEEKISHLRTRLKDLKIE